jgi:uncharacterized membrane protein YhaH (DUF805 family)
MQQIALAALANFKPTTALAVQRCRAKNKSCFRAFVRAAILKIKT